MSSADVSSKVSGPVLQETAAFFEGMRDKGAMLTAASRTVKYKGLPSSSEIVRALESAADAAALLPGLEAKRQELVRAWAAVVEIELNQLEADLREGCAARGWRVDGQWPRLIIERGIDISIDIKKQRVEVGPARLKDVNSKAVMASLEVAVPELLPKNFSTERFLGELAAAHSVCGKGAADPVPIFCLYKAWVIRSQPEQLWRDARASRFISLTTDQFRARLSSLLEAGPFQTETGEELQIFPPLHPRDAIFVYQPAQRRFGYVGRIAFPKVYEGQ